ncbi:hypothetical protein FPQ18DRAFT_306579 [Pyronema domesticum]|nr:hypothetical protein FPQ18DRAFT_306579 [Pyronema domesticum]
MSNNEAHTAYGAINNRLAEESRLLEDEHHEESTPPPGHGEPRSDRRDFVGVMGFFLFLTAFFAVLIGIRIGAREFLEWGFGIQARPPRSALVTSTLNWTVFLVQHAGQTSVKAWVYQDLICAWQWIGLDVLSLYRVVEEADRRVEADN